MRDRSDNPVKPVRERRCENCAHFDAGDMPRKPGTCRANLPTLLVSPSALGTTGIVGVWVPTAPDEWCVNHKAVVS